MAVSDFDLDPRNKLGAEVEWSDGDDFNHFVSALNSGAVVRADGVPRMDELPRENVLDEAALSQLKSILANYR